MATLHTVFLAAVLLFSPLLAHSASDTSTKAPAPAAPPAHSPAPAPRLSPIPPHPPAHPPAGSRLPRTFVAVQGVVYCKPCRYVGVATFWNATALPGATVKLQCNNTKLHTVEVKGTTDKNGYFFITAPKTVTSYGFRKCAVFLVASPNPKCGFPTNINGGVTGGALRPEKQFIYNKLPYTMYSTGPFAFDPAACPR